MAAVRTMEVSQQPGTARRVRRAASSNADLPTALQDVETGAQHQMGSDIPSSQTPIRSRRATSEASNSHKSAVSGDATLTSSVVRAGLKRKRQPPADIPVRVCAICHTHTRDREEGILICINCSKAGHPTCFQLIKIIDNIRPYLQKWQCVDCKSCQECNINDEHVMLCDSCDRAWHPQCLDPPLDEAPDGAWHCPLCPPIPDEEKQGANVASEADKTIVRDDHETEDEEYDDGEYHEAGPSTITRLSISRRDSQQRSSRSRSTRSLSHHMDSDMDHFEENVVQQELEDDPDATELEDNSLHEESSPEADTSSIIDEPPSPTRRGPGRPKGSRTRPKDQRSPRKRPSGLKLKLKAVSRGTPVLANIPVAPPPKNRLTLKLRLPNTLRSSDDAPPEDSINPFDEVLLREEADTSHSAITRDDKQRFERARLAAEAKLPPPVYAFTPSTPLSAFPSTPGPGSRTVAARTPLVSLDTPTGGAFALGRPLRSQSHIFAASYFDRGLHVLPQTPGTPGTPLGQIGLLTTAPANDGLRIKQIRFGDYDIDTWYDAPFPEEYSNLPEGRLWMCEFCLKYMKSRFSASRHQLKCKARHPPGDEIYRDGGISIFEVDGRRNRIYCQNLCLLSKMFLHQKSLFYDVEPFLFYVMTETTDVDNGAHFVGYFSKEKSSPKGYNLSCIMTLPIRQRSGFGQFLIDFSYLLSRKEQRPGTPERPLSRLGALSYKNYWLLAIMRYLHTRSPNETLTVEEISNATAITRADAFTTMRDNDMLTVTHVAVVLEQKPAPPTPIRAQKRKRSRASGYRKSSSRSARPSLLSSTVLADGSSITSIYGKSPRASFDSTAGTGGGNAASSSNDDHDAEEQVIVPHPSHYVISWDVEKVNAALDKWATKGYLVVRPEQLEWSPYLLNRLGTVPEMESDDIGGDPSAAAGIELPTHRLTGMDSGMLTPMGATLAEESDPLFAGRLAKGKGKARAVPLLQAVTLKSRSSSTLGDLADLALAHEKQTQEQTDRALAARFAAEEEAALLASSPGRPKRTRSGGVSGASWTPNSATGWVPPASAPTTPGSPSPVVPLKRKRGRASRGDEAQQSLVEQLAGLTSTPMANDEEEQMVTRRAKRARVSVGGSSIPTGNIEPNAAAQPRSSRRDRRSRNILLPSSIEDSIASQVNVAIPKNRASRSRKSRVIEETPEATDMDLGSGTGADGELEAVPGLRRSSEPLGTSAESVGGDTQTPPGGDTEPGPVVFIADENTHPNTYGAFGRKTTAKAESYATLSGYNVSPARPAREETPTSSAALDHGDADAEGEDDPDA